MHGYCSCSDFCSSIGPQQMLLNGSCPSGGTYMYGSGGLILTVVLLTVGKHSAAFVCRRCTWQMPVTFWTIAYTVASIAVPIGFCFMVYTSSYHPYLCMLIYDTRNPSHQEDFAQICQQASMLEISYTDCSTEPAISQRCPAELPISR